MKRYAKTCAIALSAALALSLASACGKTGDEAATYVGIDVNPSVSLILDGDGKVLSVAAENEDAQVLLYGEDLTGLTARRSRGKNRRALRRARLSQRKQHGRKHHRRGQSRGISKEISGRRSRRRADGLGLNFSSEGTFSVNRKLAAVNAEYNLDLTVGQFRLIAEAQKADGSLTWEAAAQMDTSRLLELAAMAAETVEPYATATYTAAKEAALYAYETAKGQLVDSLWLLPYSTTYLPDVLTGQKVNYGAIYNLYTGRVPNARRRAVRGGKSRGGRAGNLRIGRHVGRGSRCPGYVGR